MEGRKGFALKTFFVISITFQFRLEHEEFFKGNDFSRIKPLIDKLRFPPGMADTPIETTLI